MLFDLLKNRPLPHFAGVVVACITQAPWYRFVEAKCNRRCDRGGTILIGRLRIAEIVHDPRNELGII